MEFNTDTERFEHTARLAGASVAQVGSAQEALDYIAGRLDGPILLPGFAAASNLDLGVGLRERGCTVIDSELRSQAAGAAAGLTGADFAIAETGTLVLESTREEIRLASTLPPKHFVLFNPQAIVADALDAVPLLRRYQQGDTASYLAYITGPSRTADIERVLTIGVHGPKELHILLCESFDQGGLP